MLQGASEEARPGDPDPTSGPVLGDDPDAFTAGHVGGIAWNRQASFEIPVIPGRFDDFGVHEFVQRTVNLDHTRVECFAQLGRGESHAGGIAHRVGEVIEQAMQVLSEALDGPALEPQPRVAEKEDGSDAHDQSIGERGPSSRSGRLGTILIRRTGAPGQSLAASPPVAAEAASSAAAALAA